MPDQPTPEAIERANAIVESFVSTLPERIESEGEYQRIASTIRQLSIADRAFERFYAPIKRSAYTAWKQIVEHEKNSRATVTRAVERGRALLNDYSTRQRRLAMEAEALRRAAAESLPTELQEFSTQDAPVPAAPSVAGVATRTRVIYEITDPIAILRGVTSGALPRSCVEINDIEVARVARALYQSGHPLPEGVRRDEVASTAFMRQDANAG